VGIAISGPGGVTEPEIVLVLPLTIALAVL
jgi:hypothetical protein